MYLKVKVITKAKKEEIKRLSDDALEIRLREPAERNMANKRVLAIIQEMYSDCAVRMISGHHHPTKILSID